MLTVMGMHKVQIGSRNHSQERDVTAVRLTVEHCHLFYYSMIEALISQQIFDNY
jgi:hypothetical protein